MNEREVERGASFTGEKTRTQTLKHAETSRIKYDLIGKVAEGTTLTRRTVSTIFQGIKRINSICSRTIRKNLSQRLFVLSTSKRQQ